MKTGGFSGGIRGWWEVLFNLSLTVTDKKASMFDMKNKILDNCKSLVGEDERDVLFGIINRYIGYFTTDSQRQSQNDPGSEYPFVPMDTRQVYDQ